MKNRPDLHSQSTRFAPAEVSFGSAAVAARRLSQAPSAPLCFQEGIQRQIVQVQKCQLQPSRHPADRLIHAIMTSMAMTAAEDQAHNTETDPDTMNHHEPVMPREVLDALAPADGKRLLDGTFGGGGHTRSLLEAGARVDAFDRDAGALADGRDQLHDFLKAGQLALHHANFRDAAQVLGPDAQGAFDGILLDLGISSIQLDDPERGFTFQQDGPLDMRMDQTKGPTAAELVATLDEEQLSEIFYKFGEETKARRVAAEIVRERERLPIKTTLDLVEVVEKVIPRTSGKHPATRVFQALRIAVNHELGALEKALESLTTLLKPGGRLAIISFHSLEDRMVKQFFQERSRAWIDRPEWPEAKPNPLHQFRLLSRRAIKPSDIEVDYNPRARSARLRIAARL